IALVTDAGTPGISDPAGKLVQFVRENLADVKIAPIPGPSALTAALSVSGIATNKFTFLGYPPHKKGRQKFFREMAQIKVRPIVFYESRYRLQKALSAMAENFGPDSKIIVASELTKMFEEVFCNPIREAQKYFVEKKGKGEFVIIVP
ncbi:MAG: SAM-dependent methyltransferase, partial [bacterium]|nr:SAM-dependent methyltransferase [bacterium]